MKLVVLQDSLSILQLNNVIGLQTSMDANNQDQFKFLLSVLNSYYHIINI